jgi:hypothetical protein
MSEEFVYEVRKIKVGTRKVGRHWTWWYTIDGAHFKENSEELAPTESVAIQEARYHAEHRSRAMK